MVSDIFFLLQPVLRSIVPCLWFYSFFIKILQNKTLGMIPVHKKNIHRRKNSAKTKCEWKTRKKLYFFCHPTRITKASACLKLTNYRKNRSEKKEKNNWNRKFLFYSFKIVVSIFVSTVIISRMAWAKTDKQQQKIIIVYLISSRLNI